MHLSKIIPQPQETEKEGPTLSKTFFYKWMLWGWGDTSVGKGLALQVSRSEFGFTLLLEKPGIMARAHNPITGREGWRQIEPRHSLAI